MTTLLRFIQTGRVQFYVLFVLSLAVILGAFRMFESRVWITLTAIFVSGMVLLAMIARRNDQATPATGTVETEK